jgi:hypothetical protein
MSNSIIRAEFETRLSHWADAQNPKIPIAFEGVAFTKPTNGTPFLEAFLLPGPTLNRTVDGKRKTYIGLFHINCWAPSGRGMGQVERIAQAIADLFPMLPKMGRVSVEKTPAAGKSPLDDSGWLIVPVTVEYRMETS